MARQDAGKWPLFAGDITPGLQKLQGTPQAWPRKPGSLRHIRACQFFANRRIRNPVPRSPLAAIKYSLHRRYSLVMNSSVFKSTRATAVQAASCTSGFPANRAASPG